MMMQFLLRFGVLSLLAFSTLFPALFAQTSGQLPVFNVASYGASGRASLALCSGVAGTRTLTSCSLDPSAYKVGQGLVIQGQGAPTKDAAVAAAPVVTRELNFPFFGFHSYCYVVSTADPLEGISAPSPQACESYEPDLSYSNYNTLTTTGPTPGPSVAYLWYVSKDGAPFQLFRVTAFNSSAQDMGELPGTRGGWPNNLPANNPNIAKNEDFFTYVTAVNGNQLTVADALPVSFHNAYLDTDDTRSVQSTIDAAVAAGGGTIQFNDGNYVLRRPAFASNSTSPVFSPAIGTEVWSNPYTYLSVSNSATGNLHFQGTAKTQLVTPPDHGGAASLIALGYQGRPDYQSKGLFKIAEVAKGATQVSITGSPSGEAPLQAGDDIWLYSGSFSGQPCSPTNGTSGDCHFSELNTVAATDGAGHVTLTYPASKRYYDDGSSSFGLVRMARCLHDVSIEQMTINTSNPVIATGQVYGLNINNVLVLGFLNGGAFGAGFKRDVTIQNTEWGLGTGDASYGSTVELDQLTNFTMKNDIVVGYSAVGSEAPKLSSRIYATEGSSQLTFVNNTFYSVSLMADQTTDVVVSNNHFNNALVQVGASYGNNQYNYGASHDLSFDSFDSQASVDIESNTFTDDATFIPTAVLSTGNFLSATIANNTFNYGGGRSIPILTAYSGNVTGNTFNITGTTGSTAIAIVPDQSADTPASAIRVSGNTITAASVAAGIAVPDPGFTDTAPLCIQNNTFNIKSGPTLTVANPGSVNQSCPQ